MHFVADLATSKHQERAGRHATIGDQHPVKPRVVNRLRLFDAILGHVRPDGRMSHNLGYQFHIMRTLDLHVPARQSPNHALFEPNEAASLVKV